MSSLGPILVTGGTGFIGSYVVRALLDRGRSVCLFDSSDLSPEARFVLGTQAGQVPIDQGSIDNAQRLMEVVNTASRRPSSTSPRSSTRCSC